MQHKPKMPELGEAIFSIGYLTFALIAAICFFAGADGRRVITLFGILALTLGSGDAFHLVPRIRKALRGMGENTQWWLGLGLAVSSVTMTAFYVILYYIWREMFPQVHVPGALPAILWVTAVVRIVLCFFPQNNWFRPEGNMQWSLMRNIPFAVTGLCSVILFAVVGMWTMAIAIVLSFACYFPVVLWAKKNPKIGMLMIPKTCAYIWMLAMGLAIL